MGVNVVLLSALSYAESDLLYELGYYYHDREGLGPYLSGPAASRALLGTAMAEELQETSDAPAAPMQQKAMKAAIQNRQSKGSGGAVLAQALRLLENGMPPKEAAWTIAPFTAYKDVLFSHSHLEVK